MHHVCARRPTVVGQEVIVTNASITVEAEPIRKCRHLVLLFLVRLRERNGIFVRQLFERPIIEPIQFVDKLELLDVELILRAELVERQLLVGSEGVEIALSLVDDHRHLQAAHHPTVGNLRIVPRHLARRDQLINRGVRPTLRRNVSEEVRRRMSLPDAPEQRRADESCCQPFTHGNPSKIKLELLTLKVWPT